LKEKEQSGMRPQVTERARQGKELREREGGLGRLVAQRARGGFTVNIQWANGKLIFATIYSSTGNDCRLRYGNAIRDIKIEDGKSITVDGKLVTVKSN